MHQTDSMGILQQTPVFLACKETQLNESIVLVRVLQSAKKSQY